jgi:hypothetical protein
MRSRAVICVCLIVFVTVSAWPQSHPTASMEVREDKPLQTSQAAKIKNEVQKRGVGEKPKVKVTLRDRTEVKGYISQIDADSFQVTDKNGGQSTTISYQDAMKVRSNGMSTVAKIAIGAGVVAGVMIGAGLLAYRDRD